jgi:uncharacterized membrane protein
MNRRVIITASILLILAGILIQILIKDSNTKLDIELIEFFSGIVLGTGIGLPIYLLFGKKKK